MKYEPQTLHYQEIHQDYRRQMQYLGYTLQSQKSYQRYIKEFLYQLEKQHIYHLTEVQPHHISEHYHYLCKRSNKNYGGILRPASISPHMNAINLLYNYQQQQGKAKNNPGSGLSFPKAPYNYRNILTQAEIQELYKTCVNYKERALLGIYYGCGLRKSEGEKLNIKDIHYEEEVIYVRLGKGQKRRTVPMSKKVAQDIYQYHHYQRSNYIKTYRTTSDHIGEPLILNKRGGRMRERTFNETLQKIIDRTENQTIQEKKICIHSLRHSIATHLLENGLSLKYVRDFLGHKKLESTQLYARVSAQLLQNSILQEEPIHT